MKKIILKTALFVVALFAASSLQSQDYLNVWSKNISNTGTTMLVDEAGNSYLLGANLTKVSSTGTVSWQKNYTSNIKSICYDHKGGLYVTGYTGSNAPHTLFAAKYSCADGSLIWTNSIDNQGAYDMMGYDVAVDTTKGYVYVAGSSIKTSIYNQYIITDDENIIIARFGADGQGTATQKEWGTYSYDRATTISIDAAGDVLVSGFYSTYVVTNFLSTSFDATTVPAASNDMFLMKINSNLAIDWFHKIDYGVSTPYNYLPDIITDNNNNIYISGSYQEQWGFVNSSPAYYGNHFLEKMNSSGLSQWRLEDFAGSSASNSLLFNNEGNLVWIGTYSTDDSLYNHGLTKLDGYLLPQGATFYMAQINPSTGQLIDVQTETPYDYPNAEDLGTATGKAIGIDTAGNIYVLIGAQTMPPYTTHVSVGGENIDGGTAVAKFGKPAPEISITYINSDVANNSTHYMGQVWCGKGVSSHSFKIKNVGNRIMNIKSVTIGGPDIADLQLDTTGIKKTFNPGDSTTFIVKYDPLDTNSHDDAVLTIVSNDEDETTYIINLWGKAIKFSQSVSNWTQNSFSVKYGDGDIQLTDLASTEGIPWTFSINDTNVATLINGNILHFKNAGSAILTSSNQGNISYFPYSPTRNIQVTKAQLTVTVDSKTKIKGQVNPPFTYSFSGFKFDDDASDISGSMTLTTTATTNSNIGTYGISVSNVTLSSNNYSFTWVTGNLTIVNAPIMQVKRNYILVSNNSSTGFGTVATSLTNTYKIFNTGGSPLSLSTVTSSNPQFVVNIQDFDTTMAVGDSISFTITFTPTAPGSQSAQVSIVNGDPSKNPYKLNAAGIGDVTVSVNQLSAEEVKLFPNPANSGAPINVSSSETIQEIYISDILGRTEFHTSSVFTTQLQGLLIVKIMSASGEKTMKMVVE